VLKNLLSNSVKFTDSGTVRLDVTLARPDLPHLASHLRSAGTVLSFAVSDTGIGIAADKLRMIFEAFQQADGTTSRRYGGTGLGLSISKEIARLLGGSIAVSSAVGHGSTFTLYLPAVPLAQMPAFGVTPGEPDDVLMIVGGVDGGWSQHESTRPALAPAGSPAAQGWRNGVADRVGGVVGQRGGAPTQVPTTVGGSDPGSGAANGSGGGSDSGGATSSGAAYGSGAASGPGGPGGTGGAGGASGAVAPAGPVEYRVSPPATTAYNTDWRSGDAAVGTPFLTEPADTDTRPTGGDIDDSDPLVGTTVLVVDDDVRNVFALTSALEMYGMRVLYADNGHDAIRTLQQDTAPVHLVLMDVMLPGMDGNETTSMIRDMPAFADLPILVLTAKAMPGDREKSITAGATDYITKPVDLDHLLGVMRSYLY
jgi:CheY-like chemotaxis protein